VFPYGSNTGTFGCCGSEAIRFSTSIQAHGCQAKSHVPRNLDSRALEGKFIDKHRDALAEPAKLSGGSLEDDAEDTKTEQASEAQASISQSNPSLLKSQRKKMRLMSLLELLEEYVASRFL
jgi:hypothetical protein